MPNNLYQALTDIAEIVNRHGVINVVMSPGSRSAPLALSFIRNGKFEIYQIVDERSAGYFALGLAKASTRPTVLICTSGTAAYNYAPSVAEAYFQEIPLIVLTSDRPHEWIGQNDNQAIYQQEMYGKHALGFVQMPVDYSHRADYNFAMQKVNEMCLKAFGDKMGPVHLNFPFREPFYPAENAHFTPSENLRVIGHQLADIRLQDFFLEDVKNVIDQSENIWILAGMSNDLPNEHLINEFVEKTGALLFVDPLSNLHLQNQSYLFDNWLKNEGIEPPDLVVSFGNHFLSKSLKTFLRKNPPQQHLHIQEHAVLSDPFSSISFLVQSSVNGFFAQMNEFSFSRSDSEFNWQELEQISQEATADDEYLQAEKIIDAIPEGAVVHFGNSTPVRYLLRWGASLKNKGIMVFANRGTSGIDGSVSTAIGMAQDDDRPNFLVIGDLSMYYDRNGLWNKYVPANFKIVVINNSGGGIFKRIDGPKKQQELDTYFVNEQPTNFQLLAQEHGFSYHKVAETSNLETLFQEEGKTLFEVKV